MKIGMLLVCILSWSAVAKTLVMEVGQTRLIDTLGVKEVLLGDGSIGEIKPLDAGRSLVVAKTVGETEMYFFSPKVTEARLRVMPAGTSLGAVRLRLVLVEVQEGRAEARGLGSELSVDAETRNGGGSLDVLGRLRLAPSSQNQALKIVAQPRLRLSPAQDAELKVGGEIEREGQDGAVVDKAYGLELTARFHWLTDGRAELAQHISLKTPSGSGEFRIQSLQQTTQLELLEVVEFARFNAQESAGTERAGWPFQSRQSDQQRIAWKVLGWLEPLENS